MNNNQSTIDEYQNQSKMKKLRFKRYCFRQRFFNKLIHRITTFKRNQEKKNSISEKENIETANDSSDCKILNNSLHTDSTANNVSQTPKS